MPIHSGNHKYMNESRFVNCENVQVSKTKMFLSDIKHSRNELDQVGFIKEIQDNIASMEEVTIMMHSG